MNKFKKGISSIGIFIIGMISKVYAAIDLDRGLVTMYAVDPGTESPISTIGETTPKIAKITLPVILFIIGLIVILSKKITKRVKAIIISVLTLLGILGWFIMSFIAEF